MQRDDRNYWQNFNRQPYSRRSVFKRGGALGAGAAGLALVGCGNDDDDDAAPPVTPDDDGEPEPTPDADAIRMGGHFDQQMGGSPRSLDFHFDTFPYNTWVTTNIYNGLLKFSRDWSEVETDLAVSLPENPDELTWSFKINRGVHWHDVEPANGRELTAEDVKFSIERQMTDDPGTYQHAYFFLGHVSSIDAPDEETVVFTTEAPYAPFLSYVASPWTLIANPETVDQYGDLTEHAVGTGAFIFREWQHDVKFVLEKNPNYWKQDDFGNQLPYIDTADVHVIEDADTVATVFIDEQMDAVLAGEAQFQRVLDARPNANYMAQPSQFWRQFRMQPTTPDQPYRAPFDDIRVRQAIVQAQDGQEILDLVYNGDGILTYGPTLPIYEQWALQDFVPGSEFDPANARALLEAAGDPTIEGDLIWASTATQLDQVAELHQAQLAENIGVNLRLSPMELAAYYNQTYAYDYTFSSHTPLNNPDPDENLASYFGRNATFFRHHNEEIWDLIDQQARILDLEERAQVVREVEEKIVLDFPMKFLYTTNVHMFTAPRVQNWFWSADLYEGRIEGVWLDDA